VRYVGIFLVINL